VSYGIRYRLIGAQGGGAIVGAGTDEEFVEILREKYGDRLLWVELPDGIVIRFGGAGADGSHPHICPPLEGEEEQQ
jgi:hypothetical protein